MEILVNCTICKKQIKIDEWWYNYRLKRNNNRGIFCSRKCGATGKHPSETTSKKLTEALNKAYEEGRRKKSPYITVNCLTCGKDMIIQQWDYDRRLKRNERGIFCSIQCSLMNHETSEETKNKISQAQKGISVKSRGRKGHSVSQETREKIRQAKLGKPSPQDHDIIVKELEHRKVPKYALTKGLVPDAIWIEDGKLVAFELEKKQWETAVRAKMDLYEGRNDYDKVIIVWYSPKGERLKEWQKENGEWQLVLS